MSHRIRPWLLKRQASALLRRANRPYLPSQHIGGTPRSAESPKLVTALGFAMVAACFFLAINVLVQP